MIKESSSLSFDSQVCGVATYAADLNVCKYALEKFHFFLVVDHSSRRKVSGGKHSDWWPHSTRVSLFNSPTLTRLTFHHYYYEYEHYSILASVVSMSKFFPTFHQTNRTIQFPVVKDVISKALLRTCQSFPAAFHKWRLLQCFTSVYNASSTNPPRLSFVSDFCLLEDVGIYGMH